MIHELDVISLCHSGMEAKCKMAQHSTGWMAGAFAEVVQAKHLVLTHFSARYYEIHEQRPQRPRQVRGTGFRVGPETLVTEVTDMPCIAFCFNHHFLCICRSDC